METQTCILNLSYPDISDISPDPRLASLLYEAYAGRQGEITAISNYIYQSIVFKDPAPILSELLECISITEMKHFKILGKMILLLGRDPVIKAQIRGTPIDHRATLISNMENALTQNIESEKRAVEYYKKVALHTHDKAVTAMLKRIIMDEEHHIKLFYDMLEKIR